jgi:Fe-S-cluster containining protein
MNRHDRRANEAQHKAALTRANARLKTGMSEVYNQLDQVIDKVVEDVEQSTTVSCSKGCAYCCDQMVSASLVEVEYIVARYPALVQKAVAELRQQEARMVELGVHLMREAGVQRQIFLDRWYKQRIPCVFLDRETKECRVYEARPYACRSHFAITQPAEVCDSRPDPDVPGGYDNRPMMTTIDTQQIAESHPTQLLSQLYIERHGRERFILGPLQTILLYAVNGTR